MNKVDEAVKSALVAMIRILHSDVTSENGSRLLKLYSDLEKIGAHDVCEYYKPDLKKYFCRLQIDTHEN